MKFKRYTIANSAALAEELADALHAAEQHSTELTGEELVAAATAAGFDPNDEEVWGAILVQPVLGHAIGKIIVGELITQDSTIAIEV